MVVRWWVVAVHSRSTRLVVLTAVLLGLTIGSWQIDGQLQAPVPSESQEENRGPGYAHLRLIQDSVTTLASRLAEIYPDDCDSVSCDVCSQDECLPLTGIKSCAKVKFNARCSPRCPSNSSIMVTTGQSSSGYPRSSGGSGSPDDPQTKSICGTVGLDSTFKTLYARNPYYSEYYVGFPDGGRRSFPGKEEADPTSLYPCTSYDSRIRPWYNAAISNRNHLVVLVESRKAEALDTSYTEWPNTLAFAKGLAEKLLGTVSDKDRINIVPFTSAATASALLSESVEVAINQSDPQTHEELTPLKQKLDELQAAQDDGGDSSSNLTAGLEEALRLFRGRSVSDMRTKNVIVFTNGGISFDATLNTTLDELYANSVRLFIFSMKNTDDKHQALHAVAERAHGLHTLLLSTKTLSTNPLYDLRAYFMYLAEMQFRSDRTMPFWTPVYRDFYDIGRIYTVVTPAFSKSEPKRLIGVAAIDVLYEELEDIKEDFQIALTQRQFNGGSSDAYASIFQSISMRVYDFNEMASCEIKLKENALCTPRNRVDPKQNFLERFCCLECSGSSDRLRTLLIALPTAVLGFLLLVILSLVAAWLWRSRQSTVAVVEGDSGIQDEKLESTLATPTGRKSTDNGLRSPRAKRVEKANNSSGTPLQIHHSVIRFSVDKFTSPP